MSHNAGWPDVFECASCRSVQPGTNRFCCDCGKQNPQFMTQQPASHAYVGYSPARIPAAAAQPSPGYSYSDPQLIQHVQLMQMHFLQSMGFQAPPGMHYPPIQHMHQQQQQPGLHTLRPPLMPMPPTQNTVTGANSPRTGTPNSNTVLVSSHEVSRVGTALANIPQASGGQGLLEQPALPVHLLQENNTLEKNKIIDTPSGSSDENISPEKAASLHGPEVNYVESSPETSRIDLACLKFPAQISAATAIHVGRGLAKPDPPPVDRASEGNTMPVNKHHVIQIPSGSSDERMSQENALNRHHGDGLVESAGPEMFADGASKSGGAEGQKEGDMSTDSTGTSTVSPSGLSGTSSDQTQKTRRSLDDQPNNEEDLDTAGESRTDDRDIAMIDTAVGYFSNSTAGDGNHTIDDEVEVMDVGEDNNTEVKDQGDTNIADDSTNNNQAAGEIIDTPSGSSDESISSEKAGSLHGPEVNYVESSPETSFLPVNKDHIIEIPSGSSDECISPEKALNHHHGDRLVKSAGPETADGASKSGGAEGQEDGDTSTDSTGTSIDSPCKGLSGTSSDQTRKKRRSLDDQPNSEEDLDTAGESRTDDRDIAMIDTAVGYFSNSTAGDGNHTIDDEVEVMDVGKDNNTEVKDQGDTNIADDSTNNNQAAGEPKDANESGEHQTEKPTHAEAAAGGEKAFGEAAKKSKGGKDKKNKKDEREQAKSALFDPPEENNESHHENTYSKSDRPQTKKKKVPTATLR